MGATADDVPATERMCKHAVDIESLDARGILAEYKIVGTFEAAPAARV